MKFTIAFAFIFSITIQASVLKFNAKNAYCSEFNQVSLGDACILDVYSNEKKLFTIVFDFDDYIKLMKYNSIIEIDLDNALECSDNTKYDLRITDESTRCIEYSLL